MSEARLKVPIPDSAAGPSTGYGLPDDLLAQSRRRIRLVAVLVLVAAGLDTVQMLAAFFVRGGHLREGESIFPFASNLVTVACTAVMVFAAGSSRIRTRPLLHLALAFEVFLCVTISLANPLAIWEATGRLPIMTWVTPVIILFPLIVPCPPRLTLITAIIGASTRPLGLLVLGAIGRIEVVADDYFASVFSPAVAVVIATFGSRVVYGLGVEIAKAREMGSYTLERILGRGGMGEVWLARHRLLARPAAVKLIRPDLPGVDGHGHADVMIRRFEREAQATAALRSPHAIQLYDFGVSDDGTFYYVMELLDGLDAATLVSKHGPLSAERTVFVLRQVCHSLAEAHETALIHRDIKPANVYLCRYGRDFDFVKLLDFGLVKTAGDGEATTLTMDGAISGTPAFMAPEQAKGPDRVDARSDLYAVGCLGYWLLTGQLVFEGESALDVLMKHVQEEPVPPSRRTELPVPEALDDVILACLRKDPADRPQSAAELSERLARCPGDWTNEEAHRWWESHRPEPAAV